jgi:polyhydroxyalkanoate synthesis repressor PhaR
MREFKKYPNRRLYDLEQSHYVTVDDVRKFILSGDSIRVTDSKDGSDITRQILLQILSEQEAEGHEPVLTNRVIEQVIRFYGDNVGSVVSRYIEAHAGNERPQSLQLHASGHGAHVQRADPLSRHPVR